MLFKITIRTAQKYFRMQNQNIHRIPIQWGTVSTNKFAELGRCGEARERTVYKTLEVPDEMCSTVDKHRQAVPRDKKTKRTKKKPYDSKGKRKRFNRCRSETELPI